MTDTDTSPFICPSHEPKRLFGRKKSRALGKERQSATDALLPVLGISADILKENRACLPPADIFNTCFDKYVLEIGFGNGEHLFAQIRQFPNAGFMGAEPFVNGVAAFLLMCQALAPLPQNARILQDDALLLVDALEDACLDTIYVLNPDPWPKKRHHKRRIINPENLDKFARVLKPGGQLVMATDVDDLAEWMVIQCSNHPHFEWQANRREDWQTPPAEWVETRYAFRGRTAGRHQTFLIFIKV